MGNDEKIVTALTERLGPLEGLMIRRTPWFSATFSGQRLVLDLTLDEAALARLDGLADADIPLRQAFVADMAITVNRRDDDCAAVTLEILILDE